MSIKLQFIPEIPDCEYLRSGMVEDLSYRLEQRQERTSLGRPLYYRINVQLIMTQECPYKCPFCLERKHPMKGSFNLHGIKESLRAVCLEHPNARLSITGGEPGLYPSEVESLVSIYKKYSNTVFCSVNTAGYSTALNKTGAHVNLSYNDFVSHDPSDFPGCTVQMVLTDQDMRWDNLKYKMDSLNAFSFSFRYLSSMERHDYNVRLFNELREDPEVQIGTFRIGDFFVYVTCNWRGRHFRVTIGDMWQQTHNDYQDGYSNIIIHPDGHINTNWK